MATKQIGAALTLAALLSACGGGGSGDTQAPQVTASAVQGVYEGTASNGRYLNTLVLENDEFFTIYGNVAGSVLYVVGFLHGNGQSSNGSFSSSNLKDYYANGTVDGGSLSASYQIGTSFNGTTTGGGTSVSFTSAPISNSLYNYNVTPNLANVTGTWNLTDLQGNPATVTVAADGTFTGTSVGCNFTGSLSPRASGKNVFNLTVNFGSSPCILANQSVSGVALEYMLTNGKRQFIAAGMNSAKTAGNAFFGQR